MDTGDAAMIFFVWGDAAIFSGFSALEELVALALHFHAEEIDLASVADACALTQLVGGEGEVAGGDVGLGDVAFQPFEGLGGEGDVCLDHEGATREGWKAVVGGHQVGVAVELTEGVAMGEAAECLCFHEGDVWLVEVLPHSVRCGDGGFFFGGGEGVVHGA